MKKQLIISAMIDTSAFDKSVTDMQKKLRDLHAPQNVVGAQAQTAARLSQMGVGGISAPAQAVQERASLEYRKNLDTYIKNEYKEQEKLVKLIGSKESGLKKLADLQAKQVKDSKEELEIRQKIEKVQDNLARKRQEYDQRDRSINQAADIKRQQQFSLERIANAYKFGGVGGAATAGGRMANQAFAANPLGIASSVLGAMGTAVAIGGEVYNNYTRSPHRASSNLASEINATVGNDARIIANRRSAFEAAFAKERGIAADMAKQMESGHRTETGTNLIGAMAVRAGLYGSVGSALGPLGAIAGVGIGAGVGAYTVANDPTQRALAMSYIPGPIGDRYRKEYETIIGQQRGEDYKKQLQNQKDLNPGKVLASEYYEQNYQQNLQAQRGMGIGNNQFYNGFLQRGVDAGFLPEQMTGAASGILGAGGSSRSAYGNSLLANKLSRNMDLTNSAAILGTLSGGLGGDKTTDQATIKIIAEGMKLGLDDSKFAEENRRFSQAAAEIIVKSGAGSAADFGRISGGFGKFVAEPTVAGIGAAQSAYQLYQDISSTSSGPRGNMRWAGLMSDKKLSQLTNMERQALLKIPENELTENHPLVTGFASKYGITDLAKRMSTINEGAVSRFASSDTARDLLRTESVDVNKALKNEKYRSTLTEEQQDAILEIGVNRIVEFGKVSPRELKSGIVGQVGNARGTVSDQEANARLGRDSGRGEDRTNADAAKDFGVMLQNFRSFKDEIIPSAEAIKAFTTATREMMIVLRRASDTEYPAMKKYYDDKMKALNQVQAGRVKN